MFDMIRAMFTMMMTGSGRFISGLLSTWYIAIMGGALTIAYIVFTQNRVLIQSILNFIKAQIVMLTNYATHCFTPENLTNLQNLMNCQG